jgi:hypothetical protein
MGRKEKKCNGNVKMFKSWYCVDTLRGMYVQMRTQDSHLLGAPIVASLRDAERGEKPD